MSQSARNNSGYKKLFSNTLIFAAGSFCSKLLVLLLVPLYTNAMLPDEFGSVDLISQTANILIPIFTLTLAEAVLRFGLDADSQEEKKKIYSASLFMEIAGLIIMAAFFPLLSLFDYTSGCLGYLYVYVWTSSLRQLNSTFVRADERVKLFAVDGIVTTLIMLLLNILFLLTFDMGKEGYLLAIILSDLCSSVFLFTAAKLWRYISVSSFDRSLVKDMLKYSVPLIPTTLLWLVTSISDRFIITLFKGEYWNGINSISYKIPTILTTVYTMFSQAWSMSAITEDSSEDRDSFYTEVFDMNQSFMYLASAGILLIIKPFTAAWVAEEYFISYKYSPILVLATVFTCFNVFLGTVYIARKKTKRSFATSAFAGIINIILNFALIPSFGVYGAAAATFISYFVVFFYRLADTRKYIPFEYKMSKIVINTAILIAMALINQISSPFIYIPLSIMFIVVAAINFKSLIGAAEKMLPEKILRHIPFLNKQ